MTPAAMKEWMLRPATKADFAAIRSLINTVRINPFRLDWRRFVIAVTHEGRVIGCGQIKPHYDGTYELASIAVEPSWRHQGVAHALIDHLLRSRSRTLYLTCRASLRTFYEQFGFRVISSQEMPFYFFILYSFTTIAYLLRLTPERVVVMRRLVE